MLKEERERRLAQLSFTSDMQVFGEQLSIAGTKGAETFDRQTILALLESKGWVIEHLKEVQDNGKEKVNKTLLGLLLYTLNTTHLYSLLKP